MIKGYLEKFNRLFKGQFLYYATNVRKNLARVIGVNLAAVLLAGVFVVHSSVCVYGETTAEKLENAKKEKQESEGKLQATQGKIDNLEDSKTALVGYLGELNSDLAEVSEKLSGIESELTEKEDEIAATTDEIEKLDTEIEAAKESIKEADEAISSQTAAMKKRIQYVYMNGNGNYIELLLTSSSIADFLNHAEYVSRSARYDQGILESIKQNRELIVEKMNQIESDKAELEEKKQLQEEQKATIDGLRADAAAQQGKVKGLVNQTADGISEYSGQIAQAENEAKAYEADIAQKNADIARLEAELEKERALAEKSRSMAKKDLSQIVVAEGERDLLACLIYCEAGAEPYEGQVAVGAVVMNRCMSGAFPNTITGVIYQSGQFSPVASGRLAARLMQGANDSCYRAADAALAGNTPVGDCLFFRTIIPQIKGQIIGNHVFYNP